MPLYNRKLQFLAVAGTLLALSMMVGCKGFFVNPNLTTVTVGPATPSIQQGGTFQMTATGTFDDGSQKTLTGNVLWSSSDSTIATVSNSGVVSGVSAGSATITATSGTVSGSTSVTITLANLVSIAISPTNPSISNGSTQQFKATGTVQGGSTVDISNSVTWLSSVTTVAQISSGGLATAEGAGQTTITASSGNITSPPVTLTVTP